MGRESLCDKVKQRGKSGRCLWKSIPATGNRGSSEPGLITDSREARRLRQSEQRKSAKRGAARGSWKCFQAMEWISDFILRVKGSHWRVLNRERDTAELS